MKQFKLLKLLALGVVLLTSISQVSAYTLYFYIGRETGWRNDGAVFKLNNSNTAGGTTINRIGSTDWYSCSTTASGTMWFVRCNSAGNAKWNSFSTSISSTNNVVRLTGWDAGGTFSMYVTGNNWNSIGDWDNANANGKMTISTTNTFSKTFTNVAASAHQFKIVEQGRWDYSVGWGGTITGTNCTTANASGNIQFTPEYGTGNTTITYDISTGAITITCPANPVPSISLSAPTSGTRGEAITLTATTQNATTPTIKYQYSTSSTFASDVNNIASTTNTTQSWEIPSGTATTTYYLRAQMTISGTTYSSSILTLKAYGKKTIWVRNSKCWNPFNVYSFTQDVGEEVAWPGNETRVKATSGIWKQIELSSQYSGFIFNNGTYQTPDLAYADYTDGACYAIDLSADGTGKYPLPTTAVDCKPSGYSGYSLLYGNDGKNGDGGTDASFAMPWAVKDFVTTSGTTSQVTFAMTASDIGKVYEFKIYGNNNLYGYKAAGGGKIESSITNQTMYTSYGNARLCITVPGTYTITFNSSETKLSVTFPAGNYVRGTFNSWGWENELIPTGNANEYACTISLAAGQTWSAPDDGFKIVYGGVHYGKNSTSITRETNTASTLTTTGSNLSLTTDLAGNYIFTFNSSSNNLTVTYPAAYKLTYSIGSVAGTSGTISTSPTTASGSYVASGNTVILTAPAAKTGYTWKGWYTNAAGTEGKITDTNRAITVTMNADKTLYACYTENSYNTTIAVAPAGKGTTSPAAGTQSIKQVSGTEVTATANTNYVFVNWTASGGGITPTSSTTNPQTFKATSAGGTITANFADQWNVKGDQWDDWATYQGMPYAGTANTFSKTFTLPAKTTYHFKVVKRAAPGGSDIWYGVNNGKTLTRASNSVTGLEANGGETEYITFTTDVAGDYTITYLYNGAVGSMKVTVTYPTAYTVTFGKGTGGNTISATATNPSGAISSGDYVASGATVTFSQTALAGYTFKGWYTTVDGNTSAGVDGSNQLTINGTKTVYAQYTPNQYTVSFDNNGGSGATPGSITVTYGQAYGTLPAGPTPPDVDQFVGWFTAQTGGTQVTSSTIVSTASNHKLWARFEHTYTVTVQYKCGTDVLRAQTTTHASETSVAAEITAPEILGYEFDEWTGDNATFADATSATTTVNVTSATTVVANYAVVPMVYFKNNPGWDDVYVTFDCGFSGDVPSLSDKPYYKMSRLGSSDIFYCVIPSTYTDNNYANWAWHIAFDNKGTGYNESTHRGTYTFNSGEFIGRKDFDPNATMFIPYVDNTQSLNGGTTYPIGCWLQYNTNYSSYKVRVNTHVQGSGGEEVQNIELRSDVAGATEFKAKVYLGNANYVYGVMLYKDYMKNTNDIWYTNVNNEANTITSATTSLPWSWEKCNDTWQRCRVKTEALGDYIFTVSFATGRPMVDIEYPVTVGDFRLVYKDLATWNVEHDASWQQTSAVFKKKVNRVDTASFFVSYGSSPALELQKCTAINPSTGAETWTKQGDNINISSITEKGVYNFTVTQNNDASSATAAYLGAYSGKYYVRTDASDGGWNDYKSSANAMTYTEYSMEHGGSSGPYSYYFMRHVNEGSNIKFVVANDYNECLTDYMIDDTYAHEWIEHEANIRFTWNHTNNEIHRAYISGSSIISDRFLVLEGDDKLFDADGHPLTGTYQVAGLNEYEMNFTDDQNWVYETTVQAEPNERVKLTAKFNGKIQYFYGAEGERSEATTYQLIGGTGSTKYKMRVVYDFKTNRLLAAWLPNGDISDPTPINADVMIIRYHQQDAQQITFSDDGKLTDVKTVYGAMEFNKYRLNNQNETGGHGDLGLSPYERDLFFISFPFDVKLNDVFGFGQYGKHWIIEYYDGKTRAQKGYWIDSPTNWKFVTKAMKDSYTLKANEGYVLALDLDELTLESPVWNYGVENVYLYFPSTATVENIQATSATVNIDTVGYQCTINRDTPHGDRRVKDSHWHLIGVPSYANADHSTSNSWAESQDDLEQTIYYPNIQPAQWASAAPFVYDWDPSLNKFGVITTTTTTFKPMHSYLVQYARDTLEWRQVNATGVAAAPKRAMFAKEPCDFRLELLQNENVIDQAFISMRDDEEVTADFDFNYDLSKMLYGAFTSKSNIYTFAGNEEVAANCLPFKDETTIVPVGLTVAEDGEYIFTIPEGTNGVGVTLVDNERQTRANLALTDYAVYLEAGTYDNRFVIEISPIEQIVTNIETTSGEGVETSVCKKLIDGVLYIVKDGKVYDARGARIQ